MIHQVIGIPGSGKTLFTLQNMILPALKKGRRVYTNVTGLNSLTIATDFLDIIPSDYHQSFKCIKASQVFRDEFVLWAKQNSDFLDYFFEPKATLPINHTLNEDQELVFTRAVPHLISLEHNTNEYIFNCYQYLQKGALIVIDEIQVIHPVTAFQKNTDAINYFTRHRKYGHEFVYITQNQEMVDKRLVQLVDHTIEYYKPTIFGAKNYTLRRLYTTGFPTEKKRFSSRPVTFNKSLFGLYNSYIGTGVEEDSKTPTIWTGKLGFLIYASVFLIVSAIILAFNINWNKALPFSTPDKTKSQIPHVSPTQNNSNTAPVYVPNCNKSNATGFLITGLDTTYICPKPKEPGLNL